MGCLWRPLAASISDTPFLCHPNRATDCFFLILSSLSSSGSVSSLGQPRWMKHCQWYLPINPGESWLPPEVTAQAVPGPAGV